MNKELKKLNLHFFFQIILFFLCILFDQITKILVGAQLKGKSEIKVIGDIIVFRYLENTGAAFGILENRMWLFYILTIIVFALLIYLWIRIFIRAKKYSLHFYHTEKYKTRTVKNAVFLNYILMILGAGAIGNLIDRIVYGHVIDFIYFKFINFPIFNFADICVTVSVIFLIIFFIFIYKEDENFSLFKKN